MRVPASPKVPKRRVCPSETRGSMTVTTALPHREYSQQEFPLTCSQLRTQLQRPRRLQRCGPGPSEAGERRQHCCGCGVDSVPGPGPSTCCRCSRETPDEMQRLRTPFPSRRCPRVDAVPTHRMRVDTCVVVCHTCLNQAEKSRSQAPGDQRVAGVRGRVLAQGLQAQAGVPQGCHQGPAPNDEVRLCAQPGYEGQPSALGHGRTFTY